MNNSVKMIGWLAVLFLQGCTTIPITSKDSFVVSKQSFNIPHGLVHLGGHSLGPTYKGSIQRVMEEYQVRNELILGGHFASSHPAAKNDDKNGRHWFDCDRNKKALRALSQMTGADESEIVMANSLTVNNALLLEAFYLPNFKTGRKKILIMEHSFASDQAVVMSVIKQKVALLKQNGLARDISDNIERMREQMVVILPSDKDGLYSISTLRQILKTHGSTIALAHLEGIPFTTGQKFYSNDVNDLLREYNIRIGWDLAHVVGNRSVSLHEDGVDYATWCGYKYLGASAGGVGGYFINNKNQINKDFFPLQGWKAMRSDMVFSKIHSFDSSLFYDDARGTRLGNPPPVEMGDAQAVLELFDEIGVKNVENRSIALTNHLIKLLQDRLKEKIRFITPLLEDQHGAMIVFQLKTDKSAEDIEKLLQKHNFSVDVRPPANIRIMPHPLYVDFQDVEKFVDTMALAL